jgi:hypothetical protein
MGRKFERRGIGPQFGRPLPWMVRVAEVCPKEERLTGGLFIKECGDLARDLVVGTSVQKIDTVRERAKLVFDEYSLNSRVRPSPAVQMIAAPTNAGEIPGLIAEEFGKRDFVTR